ncbi:hypothetical protein IWQ56_006337, partial [Coemansia nantahalensis]
IELPYGLLVNYLRSLDLTDQPRVPQLAWNYVNDLLRTPVYLCFQPETIACGAIYLAAHECGVPLPADPPWWVLFDANGEDVAMVAKAARALYLRKHPRAVPLTDAELQMALAGTLDRHIEATRADMQRRAQEEAASAAEEAPLPPPKRGPSGARSPSPDRSRSRSRRRSASRYR